MNEFEQEENQFGAPMPETAGTDFPAEPQPEAAENPTEEPQTTEAEFCPEPAEIPTEPESDPKAEPLYFPRGIKTDFEPVGYTAVVPEETAGRSKKGFRVFCAVMAAVIALTGTTLVGYLCGMEKGKRKTVSERTVKTGESVSVDLAAKPKKTDEMTAAQVYAAVNESVVGIRIYNEAGAMCDATGVIYTDKGYIVTNDHVYAEIGAPKFKVYLFDGTEYDAAYVAGDTVSDLAVLKIKGKKLKAATFGNSDENVCGENVVAVGRPTDASSASSVTKGIISQTSRRVQTTSSYSSRLIQTDSAINPGSSGGALVNMYGQVIGITNARMSSSEYASVGFAIPTTTVKRVVEQLIHSGKVTDRAKLGITYKEIDSVSAELYDFDRVGLYIASVSEDSDLYGSVGEGDIITEINGKKITSDEVVLDELENCRAGDTVTLKIVTESGGEEEYTVTLGANIGESSYSKELNPKKQDDKDASGGTFNFPNGE